MSSLAKEEVQYSQNSTLRTNWGHFVGILFDIYLREALAPTSNTTLVVSVSMKLFDIYLSEALAPTSNTTLVVSISVLDSPE